MPRKERAQLQERLRAIAADPTMRHPGVETMRGEPPGRFRARQGDWRAIFSVDGPDAVVERVGKRKEVYRLNVVRVLAETEDTVTLSRADFEALVPARENAIDHAAEERQTRLGKDAARAGYSPIEAVDRLLNGEHPLRVWREHRGMSLRGLAEAAGVVFTYISEIEGGRKPGSAEALRRVAAALGVAMEDIMPMAANNGDSGAASDRDD